MTPPPPPFPSFPLRAAELERSAALCWQQGARVLGQGAHISPATRSRHATLCRRSQPPVQSAAPCEVWHEQFADCRRHAMPFKNTRTWLSTLLPAEGAFCHSIAWPGLSNLRGSSIRLRPGNKPVSCAYHYADVAVLVCLL
jgi:hypothetical protein